MTEANILPAIAALLGGAVALLFGVLFYINYAGNKATLDKKDL